MDALERLNEMETNGDDPCSLWDLPQQVPDPQAAWNSSFENSSQKSTSTHHILELKSVPVDLQKGCARCWVANCEKVVMQLLYNPAMRELKAGPHEASTAED